MSEAHQGWSVTLKSILAAPTQGLKSEYAQETTDQFLNVEARRKSDKINAVIINHNTRPSYDDSSKRVADILA